MNTIFVQGITVDFSGVTSDGWKWRGKLAFSCGSAVATATVDATASDEIGIIQVEGESVEFCEEIESCSVNIERALEEALGDARSDEARHQARAEQEIDWSIDERRMGL